MYVCMYLAEYLPRIKTLQAAAWDSRNGQPTYPAPYTLQSTSVCVCMYVCKAISQPQYRPRRLSILDLLPTSLLPNPVSFPQRRVT